MGTVTIAELLTQKDSSELLLITEPELSLRDRRSEWLCSSFLCDHPGSLDGRVRNDAADCADAAKCDADCNDQSNDDLLAAALAHGERSPSSQRTDNPIAGVGTLWLTALAAAVNSNTEADPNRTFVVAVTRRCHSLRSARLARRWCSVRRRRTGAGRGADDVDGRGRIAVASRCSLSCVRGSGSALRIGAPVSHQSGTVRPPLHPLLR